MKKNANGLTAKGQRNLESLAPRAKVKAKPMKYLGRTTNTPGELEAIPWKGGRMRVELDCTEFTSHCPVTGQPDFGRIGIDYGVDQHIVETKSLKLWLWKFRNVAQFNERIADQIADEFSKAIRPLWVNVTAKFNTRGGISVTAHAERSRETE